MKKLVCVILAMMLLCGVACAQDKLTDGVYQAQTQGKIGPVEVEVTVDNGAIAGVRVVNHTETQGMFEKAFAEIPAQIVAHQTVNVDVVSGSTISSQALLDGVKACIEQADGKVEDYMTAIEKTVSTEVKELSTQVVVVGAGASGLSAALQAQQSGLKVVVVEKNSSTAQSASNLAAGLMALGTKLQEQVGILPNTYGEDVNSWDDVVDSVFTYWTNQMSWRVNQKMVYQYLSMSGETIDWMMDNGLQFITVMNLQDGSGWYHEHAKNYHLLGKGKYSVYAEPMLENLVKNGGEVYYNTKAEKLITDETGAVTGVTCVQTDGTTLNINADAVILCSGGFGSDTDYVFNELKFNGTLEGAGNAGTGDGMRMAWAVGAQKYKEDALLVHHLFTTEPNTDLSDLGNKINCILNYVPSFLNLNPVGTRYRNEESVFCGVEASETTSSQGYGWNVFTQSMVDTLVSEGVKGLGMENGMNWVPLSFGYQPKGDECWTELPTVLERMEKKGVMVKADTLEELAQKTGMEPDIMMKNIEEYNAACALGKDVIFKKNPAYLVALEEGPYYAMKTVTRYITSVGGLKVDERMSVLDMQEREIPGLYAAGCDAAGVIYGDAYVDIEGAGFGFAFVSGRIAAMSVAEELAQ